MDLIINLINLSNSEYCKYHNANNEIGKFRILSHNLTFKNYNINLKIYSRNSFLFYKIINKI